MINFHNEINNYQKLNKLSKGRVKKYVCALNEFCNFLAAELGCGPEEVYLDRIYKLKHGDKVIAHKPIDANIIDHYLSINVNTGFSKMEINTYAIKSFFRFLKNNLNFPDIVSSITFKLYDYKSSVKQIRILSRHELLRFLHSLISNSNNLIRDIVLFSLLISTGCRISEIVKLKVSDINFDEEMITLLKTKNKIQRVVVLRKGFGVVLHSYKTTNQLTETDFLFPKKRKLLPISRQAVSKLFNIILRKADLPDVRIHSLRHAYATHMRNEGVDLLTLMQLLGHEQLQSTLNYTQSHYTRNANIRIKEHDEFYRKLRSRLRNL